MNVARVGPVVVGIDGSANAQRALLLAGRYAARSGAPLLVVHAIGLTEMIDGEHVPTHDHQQEIADHVDTWCEALREAGHTDFEIRLVQRRRHNGQYLISRDQWLARTRGTRT